MCGGILQAHIENAHNPKGIDWRQVQDTTQSQAPDYSAVVIMYVPQCGAPVNSFTTKLIRV